MLLAQYVVLLIFKVKSTFGNLLTGLTVYGTSSGVNVGIGTISPDSPLEIEFAEDTGTTKQMLHLDYNPVDNYGSALFKISAGTNSAAVTQIEQVTSGGNGSFGTYQDTNIINRGVGGISAGNINFITGSNTSASSIVMTIGGGSQKGNVGINTTAPSEKLHVEGRIRLGSTPVICSHDNIGIDIDQNNNSGSNYFRVTRDGEATELFRVQENGHVGIGTTSPGTTLQVSGSNLTNNVAAYIGSGFVNNDLYHREGGLLVISGTNATQTSAGIAFQTRNTGNTNYWKSSILMNRGGELEFYTGGAGTGQGSERMKITSGGNIQIPTDSASLQLRGSGSGSYTSIRRDAANQLIVANTAGNQVLELVTVEN